MTTETFAEKIRRMQTEAAVAAWTAGRDLRHHLCDLLRIDGRERLGDVIVLAPGLLVAEVEGGHFGTVWRVVVDGKAHFNGWSDRWTAITSAVGLKHDAGDDAGMFAARVLNVPTTEETPS